MLGQLGNCRTKGGLGFDCSEGKRRQTFEKVLRFGILEQIEVDPKSESAGQAEGKLKSEYCQI